jgi:hypothetical protein
VGNDGGLVNSSPRLALAMLGTIVLLGVLGGGLRLISIGRLGDVALGMGMVLVVTSVLLVTVPWWAKWFFAACCLFTVRAAISVLLGRTISVPSIVAPRVVFGQIACIFAVMAFLSYRFVSAKPNWLDSVCLVGAVISIVDSLISGTPLRWVLGAALLLGVCSVYRKFVSHDQNRKPAEHF